MIEIAPETACILYLAIAIAVVAGIWLATRKKEVAPFTLQHHLCEFCHHHYIEESRKPFSRCPQCQLINKKKLFPNDP